jgi:alpha-beta hydrolase superfamily lysophospholipase
MDDADAELHAVAMNRRSLPDGMESFDVTAFEVEQPTHLVLFAVGAGGNPERHGPLLAALAERGCAVIAPHVERLASPVPTDDHLLLRARRLQLALDAVARPDLPVVGVGHSIGAAVLLALAGGALWMRPGSPLPIARDERLQRLALLTPPTGFFRPPGALDAVHAPLLVWAGDQDEITPPAQAELLKRALGERVDVDLRVIAGAGHFSFMHAPPPHVTEPLADRDAFLAELTSELCRFVVGGARRS